MPKHLGWLVIPLLIASCATPRMGFTPSVYPVAKPFVKSWEPVRTPYVDALRYTRPGHPPSWTYARMVLDRYGFQVVKEDRQAGYLETDTRAFIFSDHYRTCLETSKSVYGPGQTPVTLVTLRLYLRGDRLRLHSEFVEGYVEQDRIVNLNRLCRSTDKLEYEILDQMVAY